MTQPRYYRRIITVQATDSPNVRRELARQRGDPPETWPPEIPGVLSYEEYQQRLQTWDEPRKCIGLEARFWEGADSLLYPPDWLDHAEALAARLRGEPRHARAIGIDPGEGVANTSMTAVDDLGIVELRSTLTPDTSVIVGETIAFLQRHGVPPERVGLDRGGGGKQIADMIRRRGYPVRTVAFGESVAPEPKSGMTTVKERLEARELRATFLNRRAQMYWLLRELLDPSGERGGFAIPAEYMELRRQLAQMPLMRDGEGRLMLPPKQKREGSNQKSLTEILGCSPDEADSLVVACYMMVGKSRRPVAGAV